MFARPVCEEFTGMCLLKKEGPMGYHMMTLVIIWFVIPFHSFYTIQGFVMQISSFQTIF